MFYSMYALWRSITKVVAVTEYSRANISQNKHMNKHRIEGGKPPTKKKKKKLILWFLDFTKGCGKPNEYFSVFSKMRAKRCL